LQSLKLPSIDLFEGVLQAPSFLIQLGLGNLGSVACCLFELLDLLGEFVGVRF